MSSEFEKRDVRALVRRYKDNNGDIKNIYSNVGSAWVSDHGNSVVIQLESLPIDKEWNQKLYVNKPYEKNKETQRNVVNLNEEKKDRVLTHKDFNDEYYKDEMNKSSSKINLDEIPF